MKDSELVQYLHELYTAVSKNPAAYNKTTEDLVTMGNAAGDLQEKLENNTLMQDMAKAAVLAKNASRKKGEEIARGFIAQIKSDPLVSEGDKIAVRIQKRSPNAARMGVTAPTNLSASGYSTGSIQLKWRNGGNKYGTIYQIEACFGNEGSYSIIGSDTKCKFTHTGQTPGVMIRYRVCAKRHGITSAPSNEAIVYG